MILQYHCQSLKKVEILKFWGKANIMSHIYMLCLYASGHMFVCCWNLKSSQLFPDWLKEMVFTSLPLFVAFYSRG